MAQTDDRPFLEARIRQEHEAAARAPKTDIRAIHLDLADRYEQRLSHPGDGPGQSA